MKQKKQKKKREKKKTRERKKKRLAATCGRMDKACASSRFGILAHGGVER